jgi:hypothetical protein
VARRDARDHAAQYGRRSADGGRRIGFAATLGGDPASAVRAFLTARGDRGDDIGGMD